MPIPEKSLSAPPPQGVEYKATPPAVSNQELLKQQIEQALEESNVVYEQTQGENFLGC